MLNARIRNYFWQDWERIGPRGGYHLNRPPKDWEPDPADVAKVLPRDLLHSRNFGKKSLQELGDWMAGKGYSEWFKTAKRCPCCGVIIHDR